MVPVIDPGRRSPSSVIWRSTLLRCASSPGSVSDIGDTSSTLSVLYTFRQEAQKKATPHILTPVSRARPGARIDFQYRERVNFFSHSVLLFHNFFGSRTLVNLTRREAGENPVLPRNCKRGNRNRSLGETREGRLSSPDVERGVLTRKARRPARTVHTNPFRVTKEECMRLVRILAGFILLVTAASATELKIKVVDPQSVAVAD